MDQFSRIQRLPPYVFNITGEMKVSARRRGEDIIDFGMGNPDGATPQHIVDKMIEAAQKGVTHRYSVSRGIPRLRKAISNWYKTRYAVDIDPDTEAIVTIGSKEGIAHLCLAILDSRDTVLVPNPSYPIHIYGPVIAGAHVVSVPIHDTEQFLADLEDLIPRMTPRPKALIVNFPSNPTTQTVELPFLARLVALAHQHGFYLIHDLAYADLGFDGYKPPSVLEVPGAKEVAVEFFTLSKSYNMPGWRVGFMVGNPVLVNALARLKSYFDYGTFTPIQVASDPCPRRPAGVRRRNPRNLSPPPQRPHRRIEQARLARPLAEGDDVCLGADPRSLRGPRLSGVFEDLAYRSQSGRLARHRLRRTRRPPRPLLPHRKRGAHPPGPPRHPPDVRQEPPCQSPRDCLISLLAQPQSARTWVPQVSILRPGKAMNPTQRASFRAKHAWTLFG